MKTQLSMRQHAQGDLLFTLRGDLTLAPGHPVASEHGHLILARGEVTGHHHSTPAATATLTLDEGGVQYLTVDELTTVVHQEHAPVALTAGVWEVRRQRQLSIVDALPHQVTD